MKPLESYRILMVGQLDYGSTSWSRLKALQQIARQVEALGIMPLLSGLSLWKRILPHHLYIGENVARVNREMLEKARGFAPEILWVDKGLHVWPDTLASIRKEGCGLLIHFTPDNQMVRANQSQWYLKSIPLYDIHITTKKSNIEWLLGRQAKRVKYMGKAFDPDLHRPITLTEKEAATFGCDIGFVGRWEPSREAILLWLWRKGYKIKVWGDCWEHARHRKRSLFAQCRHLVGDEYVKAICGAKINLCLLSRWFQDKTTARSIEIPACGRFLLAERNEEHLALFREDTEAEFYDTPEEMIQKIDYYLRHESEREAISKAGRARCLAGYSNKTILKDVLGRIVEG